MEIMRGGGIHPSPYLSDFSDPIPYRVKEELTARETARVEPELFTVKTVHACPLTSKLCADAWKTGYECSLNPGNENSKLEMETPKFPAKNDFSFHWKSSSPRTETSDFGSDFLFSFLNSTQPTGWIF